MEYSATKEDVKVFVKKIEKLAKDVQEKIDSNEDYLPMARELTKEQLTLIFTLGEVYALEKTSKVTVVKPTKSFYNVRDKSGKFCKKS
jgi:hypothetical protein